MAVCYLEPGLQDYIWGGHRLVDEYNKKYGGERLAESWELSCHPAAPSRIGSGPDRGLTLQEYIDREGSGILGKNAGRFGGLPILVKFIDAKEDLSVQVHPDNAYARAHENQDGKTEMWYVMDAPEGAVLYAGFERDISVEELRERIAGNTLMEVLHREPVKRGDVLFVEPGTVHVIGKGVMVAEIQQNSNVTYRLYDYGRPGADGKPRELHVEKALEVLNRKAFKKRTFDGHLGSCEYFTVDKLCLAGEADTFEGAVTDDSFLHFLVTDGSGELVTGSGNYPFRKGDSLFITAGSGEFSVSGRCEALLIRV